MTSDQPSRHGIPLLLVLAVMTILGLAFAISIGLIFSDLSWTRFIGPGLIFGLSSTASVRNRHLTSVLIFAGGALWIFQMIRWSDAGWLSIVAGLLVLVGLLMWWLGSHRRSAPSTGEGGEIVRGSNVIETSQDEIHLTGAATATRYIVSSQAFVGGEVSVSLGNVELDLTSARLSEDGASLSLASQMANITLRVPDDWVIETNGDFKLGAVKDERPNRPTDGPRLALNVTTTMGAVQITG